MTTSPPVGNLRRRRTPAAARVLVMPTADRNPYQASLAKHLGRLGVRTFGVRPSRFWGALWQHGPNILHLHWIARLVQGQNPFTTVRRLSRSLAQLAAVRMMGIGIVWTVHEIKDPGDRQGAVERESAQVVARMADAIIAHSEGCRRAIVGTFGNRCADKTFVIPHGHYLDAYPRSLTRPQARRNLKIGEDRLVIGFVGSITLYKGVFELVDAFGRLPRGAALLLLAGKMGRGVADVLADRIRGNPDICLLDGWIPDEKIQLYMAASDVIVIPYRESFTSGSLLLALSFAKPVIAPRMGMIAETVSDNGAFLYDADRPDGLFGALERAVAGAGRLPRMGRVNHRLAAAADWGMIARKTRDVYHRALRTG